MAYGYRLYRCVEDFLQESEFKEALRNQIKEYVELNEQTAPTAGIAWEALKAVLRGFVIQQASYKKKMRSAKQAEIEDKIKKIESK